MSQENQERQTTLEIVEPEALITQGEALYLSYLTQIKEGSRVAMGHSFRVIARATGYATPREVPWDRLCPEVIHRVIEKAEERYKPPTLMRISVIFRQMAKIGERRGIYTERQKADIQEAAMRYTKQNWQPLAGRRLSLDECRLLATHPGISRRDRLILLVAMILGLRKAELCGLSVGDLDVRGGTLRVRGKGKRERHVPIPPALVRDLEGWIGELGERGVEGAEAPLFPQETGHRIAVRKMWDVLAKARRVTGMAKWSPHDLRRTVATTMLESGHDVVLVAKALGHSNIATTQAYDRRGMEATRKVFEGMEATLTRKRAEGEE